MNSLRRLTALVLCCVLAAGFCACGKAETHTHALLYHQGREATCSKEGKTEYWECVDCGKLYSDKDCKNEITVEDTKLQKIAHDTVHHEATEATDDKTGNIEYWECKNCGKLFSDAACTTQIAAKDTETNSLNTLIDFFVDVPEGRDIIVLQITDTQIIDSNTMRRPDRLDSTSISSYRNTDDHDSMEKYCFGYLREMITEVNPDFIIMTGDNTYGEFDDDGHILLRLIEFMESFEIPWAPVFGNHDLETNKGADWYSEQYENAEYCCFRQRTLSGNGNYTVGIRQGGELKRLFVMLDSEGTGNVSQMSLANGHTHKEKGFKQDQVEWYTDTITKIKNFVPTVKISFAYHIQMEMVFKAIREVYGSNLFPKFEGYVEIDPILSVDRITEKQLSDFGFINEMAPAWDSDFTIYNGIKALGVDSMFLGHCHTNCYSVLYDGIRFQFGLKSSRHDFLAIVNKSTGAMRQGFWLDTDDGNAGSCPLIGGTVIPLSRFNGSITDPYIYYCTGAGKEVNWSQWENTISVNDDWSSHYTEY